MKKVSKFLFLLLLFYSCSGSLWGSHALGSHFFLLEGDKIEDRVIVFCADTLSSDCYSGTPILPSNADSLYSYVIDAKADERWLLATVMNKDKSKSYWIVDKHLPLKSHNFDNINVDSLIKVYRKGPYTMKTLKAELSRLKSDLEL